MVKNSVDIFLNTRGCKPMNNQCAAAIYTAAKKLTAAFQRRKGRNVAVRRRPMPPAGTKRHESSCSNRI